ncbi:MAG: aminotransferase class V-fold PLP-dependent enzyme, partial [Hyphomicrobium sp.]
MLDLSAVNALNVTPGTPLPQNVEAGPSLAGSGFSRGIDPASTGRVDNSALPGATQNTLPQPPPANPPPQVLIDPSHRGNSQQQGLSPSFGNIPLPFEAELKSLLAPLAAQPASSAHGGENGSSLYFLGGLLSPSAGIGVPGLATPQFDPSLSPAHDQFDVQAIRRDFPILNETVNGRPLIWFDNAATTQKPKAVIDRLTYFYEHENSNIHRAAHELAARATDAYEGARSKVAKFLNARSADEIIFTRGATEAINLVAATFGNQHIGAGDEIVVTNLEHHANIVPWQQLALSKGAKLRVAPVDDNGALLLDEFGKLLNARTKLVAFTQVSNALGTITPAKTIIEMAHRAGARVLVDGAQSVSHMKVD